MPSICVAGNCSCAVSLYEFPKKMMPATLSGSGTWPLPGKISLPCLTSSLDFVDDISLKGSFRTRCSMIVVLLSGKCHCDISCVGNVFSPHCYVL